MATTVHGNVKKHSDDDVSIDTDRTECTGGSARPRGVKFGMVHIRTHDVILGDNPVVSRGPPLALNWDAVDSEHFSLEDYENKFGPGGHAKKVSIRTREDWLREMGHTTESFNRVCTEIEDIQISRQKSKKEMVLTSEQEYFIMTQASRARYHQKMDRSLLSVEERRRASKKEKSPSIFPRFPRFMRKLSKTFC